MLRKRYFLIVDKDLIATIKSRNRVYFSMRLESCSPHEYGKALGTYAAFLRHRFSLDTPVTPRRLLVAGPDTERRHVRRMPMIIGTGDTLALMLTVDDRDPPYRADPTLLQEIEYDRFLHLQMHALTHPGPVRVDDASPAKLGVNAVRTPNDSKARHGAPLSSNAAGPALDVSDTRHGAAQIDAILAQSRRSLSIPQK